MVLLKKLKVCEERNWTNFYLKNLAKSISIEAGEYWNVFNGTVITLIR